MPPLKELPPTFWEAHGWQALLGFALVGVGSVILARWFLRRLLPEPLPPEILARRSLEALRDAPDDETTAAEVARQLRCLTQVVLALPEGELTTDELLAALRPWSDSDCGRGARTTAAGEAPAPLAEPTPTAAPLPAELCEALTKLLRECDARRFAPVPPAGTPGLAARALTIADRLLALRSAVLASSAAVSESAGNSRP